MTNPSTKPVHKTKAMAAIRDGVTNVRGFSGLSTRVAFQPNKSFIKSCIVIADDFTTLRQAVSKLTNSDVRIKRLLCKKTVTIEMKHL